MESEVLADLDLVTSSSPIHLVEVIEDVESSEQSSKSRRLSRVPKRFQAFEMDFAEGISGDDNVAQSSVAAQNNSDGDFGGAITVDAQSSVATQNNSDGDSGGAIAVDEEVVNVVHLSEGPNGRGVGVDEGDIQSRLNPEVPGPVLTGEEIEDDSGWAEIDRVGAVDCALSEFSAMDDVPFHLRALWGRAMETVLRKIQGASNGDELDRALKWFLLLPQAFLRTAPKGGQAGRGLVASRFNALTKDDWGSVFRLWEKDREKVRERAIKRRNRPMEIKVLSTEEVEEKLRRTVVGLVGKAKVSKAVNRLNSHGVADMSNPEVKATMKSKYIVRGRELPSSVPRGQCVDNLRSLRSRLLSLHPGTAPGSGGFRPEFLIALAELWEDDQMRLLEEFGMRYLAGDLPPWFDKLWLSQETMGLFKTKERSNYLLRPIGMRNPLAKSFHAESVQQNHGEIIEYLEPRQLGNSVAGGHKLLHSIRMLLEYKPNFICAKLDFRNAHCEISRAAVVESLLEVPSLQHLGWHAACVLAPSTILETRGESWGMQVEGGTQGDPETGLFFNVAIQKDVVVLDKVLENVGGMARFGQDDGYTIGPAKVVFPAVEKFTADVKERCGLSLQWSKTEAYCPSGVLPSFATQGIVLAGEIVDDVWENGFICYGVPVGSDKYVRSKLNLKVEEVTMGALRACQVLGESEKMTLWQVLRQSISKQFDWWLSLVYPSIVREAARDIDRVIWGVLESVAGSHIPRRGEGKNWDCPLLVPVERWHGWSYQQMRVRLPVRSGGLGLVCLEDLSPAAFIGSVEQSLPHFLGVTGVCTQLQVILGGNTGQMSPDATRWSDLLDSNCRTGREFAAAWGELQTTAQQACSYLDRELQGVLESPLVAAGNGAVDGSSRRKAVQQLESLQLEVLEKALEDYPDRSARPVIQFRQLDKVSSAWVSALPGPETYIPSPAFSEAVCSYLCVPSPACRDLVGQRIGRESVDIWGDKVMKETHLSGDSFRHKHDKVKMRLYSLANECKLPATCEVFSAFAPCIPQRGLSRIEKGRQRQTMIPDFKFEIPNSNNPNKVSSLAELKTITCCQSYHFVGATKRGVEIRGDQLPGEYLQKSKRADKDYCGTVEGQMGPVESRLRQYPPLIKLVVGPWGEVSDDTHDLLEKFAQSRVKHQSLLRGKVVSHEEKASIITYLRRQLSICVVRANVECLFARLQQVGAGHGAAQAAKRRAWSQSQEERGRRERAAHWLAQTKGHRSLKRGHFMRI